MYFISQLETLVGTLHLVTDDKSVYVVAFDDNWEQLKQKFQPISKGTTPLMAQLKDELNQYFQGKRKKFSVPLKFKGTEFQEAAWLELASIPFGQTRSYQQQATNIQKPKAVRAVGAANGKNPLCILLPCHRIIAKSGKLQGFAADIRIKEILLSLEQSN